MASYVIYPLSLEINWFWVFIISTSLIQRKLKNVNTKNAIYMNSYITIRKFEAYSRTLSAIIHHPHSTRQAYALELQGVDWFLGVT